MSGRVENLKEIVRYGAFLSVKVPSIVLKSNNEKHVKVQDALNEFKNESNIHCRVFDFGDETQIDIGFTSEFIEFDRPLSVDLKEWDSLNTKLDKSNRRISEIKEIYLLESDRILKEARETKVDFKALYGANNKDTRKQYVDEQLSELLEEKKELEFSIADDNRRLAYLKELIRTKRSLN